MSLYVGDRLVCRFGRKQNTHARVYTHTHTHTHIHIYICIYIYVYIYIYTGACVFYK